MKVVDTNVAKVANGRYSNARPECRLAAMYALKDLLDKGRVVIDAGGDILREYRRHFNANGAPGVGDQFFRVILMEYSGRVFRVDLQKNSDGSFTDFPSDPALVSFDLSDRKFAAASRVTGAPVLNATDGDWVDHLDALRKNGVEVEFVCGSDPSQWHTCDSLT